ncbi:hypothetical protein N9345_04490 [Candidatus Thioglobus sp.]|nr:hypothetical protein [Candidatus Thioglobus sp.]MDB3893421.1 hypothetical protein [Candidatus Thioglobus sp.]
MRIYMGQLIKLTALIFVIAGISACGRMGELETVKPVQVAVSQVAVTPELDILPHNSK